MKNRILSFTISLLYAAKQIYLILFVIMAITFAIIIGIYLRSGKMLEMKLQSIAILFVIFGLISFSLWLRSWQINQVQYWVSVSRQERVVAVFSYIGKGLFFIGLFWLIINSIPLLYIMSSQTDGIVMESHTIQDSKNSSSTCIKKVSYTANNQRYILTDEYMLSPLGTCHPAGEKIKVSFDTSNPSRASSMSLFERFFYPAVLLFVAMISFLISYLAKIAK